MVNQISEDPKTEKEFSIEIMFIIFLIFIGFFFQNLAFNELKQAMFIYEYHQVKDWKTVKLSDDLFELKYNHSGMNARKETPTFSIYDPQLKKYVIKKQYSYLQANLIYDAQSIYPLNSKKTYKLDHALFITTDQKSVVDPTRPIILFVRGELLLEDGHVLTVQANDYLPSSKAKAKIQLQRQLFFFFIPTSILFATLSVFFCLYQNFKEDGVDIICFAITGIALFFLGFISISKVIIPWMKLT